MSFSDLNHQNEIKAIDGFIRHVKFRPYIMTVDFTEQIKINIGTLYLSIQQT